MDVHYVLDDIRFVWDSQKTQTNRARHGVSFEEAAEAFFDPFLCLVDATDQGEGRDAIIAMDERWRVLFVVHIQIEDDLLRIISARRAGPNERKYYES